MSAFLINLGLLAFALGGNLLSRKDDIKDVLPIEVERKNHYSHYTQQNQHSTFYRNYQLDPPVVQTYSLVIMKFPLILALLPFFIDSLNAIPTTSGSDNTKLTAVVDIAKRVDKLPNGEFDMTMWENTNYSGKWSRYWGLWTEYCCTYAHYIVIQTLARVFPSNYGAYIDDTNSERN